MFTKATVMAVGMLAALTSCSDSGALFESLAQRAEGTSRTRLYDSWQTLLAAASCGEPGEDGVDVAVEGRVLDVVAGAGLLWKFDENGENSQKIQVAFDDPSAEVKTVHFALQVDRVIGKSLEISSGDQVKVGLAVSPDVSIEQARKDLESASPAIYFLETSPVFDYAMGLRAVSEDGMLIAVPDKDGQLSFPALSTEDRIQPPGGTSLRDAQPSDCPTNK